MFKRWLCTSVLLLFQGLPQLRAQAITPARAGSLSAPVAVNDSASVPGSLPSYFKTGVLDIESRVWAQTQIERTFYNHRIWPKENPQPKPPFEEMVRTSLIEKKAITPLLQSAALNRIWNFEITPAMLQEEMDRMARDTKDPATLRELFSALGNDPSLIAEVFARGILSDRLIRELYAHDAALHALTRARAEAIWHAGWRAPGSEVWQEAGDAHWQESFSWGTDDLESYSPPYQNAMRMSEQEFIRFSYALPPDGEYAPMEEKADGFLLSRVRSRSSRQIEIENLWIPKRKFDAWWQMVMPTLAYGLVQRSAEEQTYQLPAFAQVASCNVWSAMSTVNAPSARSNNAAVWTGAEMIIWGGSTSSGATNSGGRYTPATDSWAPTSIGANAPAPRNGPSAVWSGTEMIVWGGWQYTGSYLFFNAGGRYNTSSDSWQATSTGINTPAARMNHRSIWTGMLMIIWGGQYCDTFRCSGGWIYLNTGGRYDPIADVWKPTAISGNVPTARSGHSEAWIGDKMVIWSGFGGTYTNTGGLYIENSDNWLFSSTANAPAGRTGHTTVWTGSEMISWGGGNNGGDMNSGGQYNPVSNRWVSTNIGVMTPSVRSNHSAIWTGNEMIVWGGYTCSGSCTYFNDGGRYNPDNGNWLSISLAGAPVPRSEQHAVWTGTVMLIWGGTSLLLAAIPIPEASIPPAQPPAPPIPYVAQKLQPSISTGVRSPESVHTMSSAVMLRPVAACQPPSSLPRRSINTPNPTTPSAISTPSKPSTLAGQRRSRIDQNHSSDSARTVAMGISLPRQRMDFLMKRSWAERA